MVISVSLAAILLLTVGILSSSVHSYLIKSALKENPYHVSIKAENFKKPSFVKKQVYQNNKVSIIYKTTSKTYKNTKYICKKIKCKNIKYNEKLLKLYGITKNQNILKTLKTVIIIISTVLGFCLLMLITNSYKIAIIERKKQIGVLKSIGMTKYGIIIMFLKEATIILAASLLIGITLSLWLNQILIVNINYLLKDMFKINLTLDFYPSFMIVSLIYIIVILYISCLIPAVSISKKSIIEVIRQNNSYKKKIPKVITKLKPINKIIFINYYQNKKKQKPVKISIFISVLLYITFSLYINYGLNSLNKTIKIPEYDLFLTTINTNDNYKKLNKFKAKYQKAKIYKICTIKGKINYNKNQTKNIIVVENKQNKVINVTKNKNSTVSLNNQIIKTEVKMPFGLTSYKNKIIFLTNDFSKYCQTSNLNLYIKDKKNIVKDLKKIKSINFNYVDVKKANKITKNFILAIKISLYSVISLVILISIFLIYSTFSVNLAIRTGELGLLKSSGFTNKKLKKLLFIESLITLIKIFILIIPICMLINNILFQSINSVIKIKNIFPTKELLISFSISLLLIYLTINSNYKNIKDKSITKLISTDNN